MNKRHNTESSGGTRCFHLVQQFPVFEDAEDVSRIKKLKSLQHVTHSHPVFTLKLDFSNTNFKISFFLPESTRSDLSEHNFVCVSYFPMTARYSSNTTTTDLTMAIMVDK